MEQNISIDNINFLQQAFANSPAMAAIVRADDLRIMFTSHLFEHYLGYSLEYLQTNEITFSQLLDPYQVDRLQHHINSVNDSIANRTSYVIYKLTGQNRPPASFYAFISPIFPTQPAQPLSYHILLQPDLSQWRMPFTSFATRELFLEQFQSENFGTFEWVIGVDKTYWSPGLYKIYEVDDSFKQIDRMFARSFIHPDDLDWVSDAAMEAIAQQKKLDIEFRIITAKKNVKIVHSLAKMANDMDGKPSKFAGSLRDVTSQRKIEEDLKNKVVELFQSNKELEEFAYVASHDMQEPLRKITTFGSRLSEKYGDILEGDGKMYLSRITAAAENMRQLINDLLEFSRISKTDHSFEVLDLNLILKSVTADLELIIEETKTQITAYPLPVIMAIPSQMKQLFSNIISNAIKFHQDGVAPQIVIQSEILKDSTLKQYGFLQNETYFQVSISDNGIGFEEEYASRIFNVFQRLHGKSEYPGSGIGLAICKKILDHHEGTIFAKGVPGEGATFTFIIPSKLRLPNEQTR